MQHHVTSIDNTFKYHLSYSLFIAVTKGNDWPKEIKSVIWLNSILSECKKMVTNFKTTHGVN